MVELRSIFDLPWYPESQVPKALRPFGESFRIDHQGGIGFPLPTIHTRCECDGNIWPFNPLNEGNMETGLVTNSNQWLFLSYQCQTCKGDAVRFLVRRKGPKLILSGRDPIEIVSVPHEIPKEHRERYSSAVIAYQSGQVLGAIFLQRVFIEQFWRKHPAVSKATEKIAKPTGEQLCEAYKETLPNAFKETFPSLCEVYEALSANMHEGDGSVELFEEMTAKVIKHFQARTVYELA